MNVIFFFIYYFLKIPLTAYQELCWTHNIALVSYEVWRIITILRIKMILEQNSVTQYSPVGERK